MFVETRRVRCDAIPRRHPLVPRSVTWCNRTKARQHFPENDEILLANSPRPPSGRSLDKMGASGMGNPGLQSARMDSPAVSDEILLANSPRPPSGRSLDKMGASGMGNPGLQSARMDSPAVSDEVASCLDHSGRT